MELVSSGWDSTCPEPLGVKNSKKKKKNQPFSEPQAVAAVARE
jgi:hypothetical protein